MTWLALEGLDGKYVDVGLSGATVIVLLALSICLVAYYFLRKRVERKVILVVLALFLIGYSIRLFVLLRNPLIYGIDGPWYVSKVGLFLEQGHFGEFVAPLVLYFTTGLSVFVGDATLGVKIAQAFLSALPILTIWLLARYITKNNYVSFIAALLLTLSAMTVGMSDVLRNTGALAFLPLFYLFFLKFINEEGRDWTIKTPLRIRGKGLGLTLNTNLVLSILFFIVILGCHFLTAGFAIMTVVAYIAFFTGYRRKIPWRELKFVVLISVAMLVGMVASGSLQEKVLGTANTLSMSEPVPPDLFPFSEAAIPTPPGGADGGPPGSMFIFFLPFIFMSLPAMWFTLRHKDRRYQLFTATIFLALLCSQNWIVNYMYTFRFTIMMYLALFVLMGISVWYIRKHLKKVAVGVLVGAVGFSILTLVGMGATAGAWITEEDWSELRWIGQQLPENSMVMTPGMERLLYWGPLLFEKEMGPTFWLGGPGNIEQLAGELRRAEQMTDMTALAVVERDFIEGVENLENLGLKTYNNVQTTHYTVLKLAENSEGTQQRNADKKEGPAGLPEYQGSTNLGISKENIEENYFYGGIDLSPPEISAAVYGTTAGYSAVLNWYRTEMPTQGWTKTLEDEDPTQNWGMLHYLMGNDMAMIFVSGSPWGHTGNIIVLVEGPASAFGEGPGEGGPPPGFEEPEATSEIRFNHNPLFAFILLPIELVQGLYGTAVYGILKLVVAIPLSVGLIGFLLGLAPILAHKFKKVRRRSPIRHKP